jgi:hypothetical protein
VTDFIQAWRQGEGQAVSGNAFVPLAFELGEAFQFDWSEEGLVVGGIYYRMQVSHMKLCASRRAAKREVPCIRSLRLLGVAHLEVIDQPPACRPRRLRCPVECSHRERVTHGQHVLGVE